MFGLFLLVIVWAITWGIGYSIAEGKNSFLYGLSMFLFTSAAGIFGMIGGAIVLTRLKKGDDHGATSAAKITFVLWIIWNIILILFFASAFTSGMVNI